MIKHSSDIQFSWSVVAFMCLTVECAPLVAALTIVEFMWAIIRCAPTVALSGAMLSRRVQGKDYCGSKGTKKREQKKEN